MKRVWVVLLSLVHGLASAVDRYAPGCGHWRIELVDGLCFDCAMKRIERENWRKISEAMTEVIAAHPELFKPRGKQEAKP